MPIEAKPTWSEIRVRIKSPGAFAPESMRSKDLPGLKGARMILGKPKGEPDGSMTLQAYRFDKNQGWDLAKVKTWLQEHDIKPLTQFAEDETGTMGTCPECGAENVPLCPECGLCPECCDCAIGEEEYASYPMMYAETIKCEMEVIPSKEKCMACKKNMTCKVHALDITDVHVPKPIGGEDMSQEDDLIFAELEMEVFAAGKWNGDDYTEKDLEDIISSHKAIGEQVKPYLKLGHNEEQKLAKNSGYFKDGKPALGWIDSLKKKGGKLIATFKDVPKIVAELVKKGAYKRVSAELYTNYERDKTKYPFVLKAVALLGADTPAVTTLQDVAALYAESEEGVRVVEFSENFELETQEEGSEVKMTEEEMKLQIEAEAAKFAEEKANLEKQLAESKATSEKHAEIMAMFEGVEDMKKAVLEFQSKQKEVEAKEKQYNETIAKVRKDEVKQFVDSLIKANKILPFQQKMVEEILFALPEGGTEIEFSQSELYGLKEKMTLSETVRTLFSSNPDMGMLKEFTSQEKVTSDPEVLRDELEKKFMEDHKVDYGTAQQELSKVRPDLYGIKK